MPRGSAPGERRGGRQAGVPNKLSGSLRELILGALDAAGGQAYLAKQAEASPAAFMALLGRILPLQTTGENGGPVIIEVVTGVPEPDYEPEEEAA